jgi:5-hydroxyisourate hydrolase-like protein (transthyretin family)
MQLTQADLNLFFSKVAQFVKVAIAQLETRQEQLVEMKKTAAAEAFRRETYQTSLEKAARALYDADFITDDMERKKFLRKAAEDPSYLSSVIVKVCNAADVALIGSTARVAVRQKQGEEYDPVKARAFGSDYQGGFAGNHLDDL